MIKAGSYTFDAEGKLVILNGIIGDYLYFNGVKTEPYKLYQYEGNYYYIGDGQRIVRNATRYLSTEKLNGATFDDGTMIKAGSYTFDAEGKLILD